MTMAVQSALEIGDGLKAGGRIAEAVAHLEAAIGQYPASPELKFKLANLLTDSGYAARAIPIYQGIVAAMPAPTSDVLSNYGIALYKAGRLGEAMVCLERALLQDPGNMSTRSVLLMATFDSGRIAEACEQGRRMLKEKDAAAMRGADSAALARMRSQAAVLDWRVIAAKPRVIAMSLWGDRPKYLDGMMMTLAQAARFYPGWTVRVYVDSTVPAPIVAKLRQRGAQVITMAIPRNRQIARLWRFMAADDPGVGFFICRDCDSPILPKEAHAVGEWTRSGKPFHIMRDHPYHAELILAGMWGGVAGLLPPLTAKISQLAQREANPLNLWIDQIFLAEHVWPFARETALVHDTALQFGGSPLREIDVAAGAGSKAPLEWNYCRHGLMVWIKTDEYIGKSLREYGEWSEGEMTLLSACIARGDVVVEGGSNIGSHTLALARAAGPEGRVIAFEPQAEVCRLLAYNAAINGLANVEARCCALGSVSGRTPIIVPDYRAMQNFGNVSTGEGAHEVELAALDDLKLERLNLLKLDVQGHELEVLRGAAQTIARLRPIIYLENDRRESAETLISFIRQMGYSLWWHTPPLYSPQNWRKRCDNVFAATLSVNMLCLPPERPVVASGELEKIVEGLPAWPRRVG